MQYEPKNFDHLLGLAGFSDALLKNHFTLYQGYVTNTNKLVELLGTKEPGTPEHSELQRRLGWEWNGMRLHEYYFGNMSKNPGIFSTESPVGKKINKVYGSFDKWRDDFVAVGKMRGIGWVVFVHDEEKDELFNVWVNEHDVGHLAGAKIILVMDVFEHAFMLDYGLKRADYIESFMKAIDWETVSARLK